MEKKMKERAEKKTGHEMGRAVVEASDRD